MALPLPDSLLAALEEAERDHPEACMALRAVRSGSGAILDFEWLWANPAAARALGRVPEFLRGRRLGEVSSKEGIAGRMDLLRQVVESGRLHADHFTEGDILMQGTAVPLRRDGVLLRLRDITSAQRVEEGLRETLDWVRDVLESMPDVFFTVDADWRLTYVNRNAAALTGRTPETLFRRVLWDACPELCGTPFERALREVAAEESYRLFELRTGRDRWHDVHVWSSGRNISTYARDITDKKRVQAERDALLARERSGRLEAEALAQRRTHELMAARERLVQSEKLAMAGQLAAGAGPRNQQPPVLCHRQPPVRGGAAHAASPA
ncbi:PAS domain-containing protein, partial [Corallococcus sp. 4LFB]|uniref:PAS domain-containing protein n=1 Tax=Corallococcus sp. 4LFB TaxID=3383249 RepID=UPI0039771184